MEEIVKVKRPSTNTLSSEDSKGPLLDPKEEEPPSLLCPYANPVELSSQEEFRKRFFKDISPAMWDDWRWQIRARIRNQQTLSRYLKLEPEELYTWKGDWHPPMAITPYYLSLFYEKAPDDPLRRSVVPTINELVATEGEAQDPLMEEGQSPVPGIVHRYPDRVLFLATSFCSTYCRYCTRSRVVGTAKRLVGRKRWELALEYIKNNRQIRDVLISGGDPLTLGDEAIGWLLQRLRAIKHVEILRIGTKVPVVIPQRITADLCKLLKRYHPLFLSIHFTHVRELTPETEKAVSMLADSGIPLGSQTVLLKGINDNTEALKALFLRLLKNRVRPYYLYQCDPILGSSHFRTKVQRGIQIMKELRGFISGYAVPTYVIDAPGGGGKVAIDLGSVLSITEEKVILKNYQGREFVYPNG